MDTVSHPGTQGLTRRQELLMLSASVSLVRLSWRISHGEDGMPKYSVNSCMRQTQRLVVGSPSSYQRDMIWGRGGGP